MGAFMTDRGLNRLGFFGVLGTVTLVLCACSSRSLNHAPVEDRTARAGRSIGSTVPPSPTTVKQLPGFENTGKPGYYTVKPGDTLIRISLDNGQSQQDVVRWNQLDNPNHIEAGQVLRVVPPTAAEVVVKPVTKPVVTTTAANPAGASPKAAVSAAPSAASSSPVVPTVTASAPAHASSKPVSALGESEINWVWPANGAVLTGFDEVKNKGIDITGTAGDPVLAAADGRVVYVGSGLRGYGNLIILKHNNVFLTAYAHNQTLLVKEDQSVQKGQKIALMGNSDADRIKLHFEVRRQGKPVDPVKFLPPR